ncbi:MAG: cytochrome b/b6 domain-containing protein, partial [Tahibacter sp.]
MRKEMMDQDKSRYSRLVRFLHWSGALVMVCTYALAELRGYVPRGTPARALMMQWHMLLGLLLL